MLQAIWKHNFRFCKLVIGIAITQKPDLQKKKNIHL